jgi:hypothetical protein
MADESKQPKAYRVEEAERIDSAGSDGFRLFVTPIYYGLDEDGPKVGDVLVPGEVKG